MPLPYTVVQMGWTWVVTYTGDWGRVPRVLEGQFTTELSAKEAIVRYLKAKYASPTKRRPKYKRKRAGRPVKARMESKSCDPNHVHGNKLKWQKQNK